MREMTLDELKKSELNILKAFTSFCDKNELYYTLAFGTLIGAIRHKGFIPWDDDIDVYMPRPDYNRLIREWHDCDAQGYHLVHLGNGGENSYAKVVDLSLPVEESNVVDRCNDNRYVWIDVFPVDAYETNSIKRILLTIVVRGLSLLRTRLALKSSLGAGCWLKDSIGVVCRLFFGWIPFRWFAVIQERIIARLQYENAEMVGFFGCGGYLRSRTFDRNGFEVHIKLKFEDSEFKCPSNYDAILSAIYGDYMKLPHENMRICHKVKVMMAE